MKKFLKHESFAVLFILIIIFILLKNIFLLFFKLHSKYFNRTWNDYTLLIKSRSLKLHKRFEQKHTNFISSPWCAELKNILKKIILWKQFCKKKLAFFSNLFFLNSNFYSCTFRFFIDSIFFHRLDSTIIEKP